MAPAIRLVHLADNVEAFNRTLGREAAVAVARDRKILFETVTSARMTMRRLSDVEIEAYLEEAGEAVTSSVGAYQLEGLGVHLFERIEGDHFTILGLPLLPLLGFLRGLGLAPLP